MNLFLLLIMLFAGYIVGRISHIIAHGRHIQSIHHWVHGLVVAVIALVFLHSPWVILLVGFGIGLIISDLNDMIKLRFYGVERFEKQRFWGIK